MSPMSHHAPVSQQSTRRRVMLGGTAAAALRQLREEHKPTPVPPPVVIHPPTPDQHDDTPLHSCNSSSLSDDSFEPSVAALVPPTNPPSSHHPPQSKPPAKSTAAAMQRQTMQHVLSQLSSQRCLPQRQGRPHAPACSRHASTSDEDECRCSSSLGGEHSPAASMHAVVRETDTVRGLNDTYGAAALRGHCSADAAHDALCAATAVYNPPRTLTRSSSLPSSTNAAHHKTVGPAWLHGNALGCKAMQAVLQQAMPHKQRAGALQCGGKKPELVQATQSKVAQPPPCCTPARWLEDVTVGDEGREGVPWCDMERLLLCITPLLHGDKPASAVTLGDVLQCFQSPSLHGLPIPTQHGSRGASTAYYVPYLSAMRVFCKAHTNSVDPPMSSSSSLPSPSSSSPSTTPQPPPLWRLPNGDVVKISAEVFESDPPFVRATLAERLPAVMAARGMSLSTPLTDLHPQSWLAVAWYPIYRIPEAPLAARFLAFYHLAPPVRVGPQHHAMPMAALCWHNVYGGTPNGIPQERWLVADRSQGDAHVGVVSGASPTVVVENPYDGMWRRRHDDEAEDDDQHHDEDHVMATTVVGDSNGDATNGDATTTTTQPGIRQVLQQLQAAVAPLATGAGIVHVTRDDDAPRPLPAPYFADYDFFRSRRDYNTV